MLARVQVPDREPQGLDEPQDRFALPVAVVSERIGEGMAKASLRSLLESARPTRTGNACKTCSYIERLPSEDVEALREFLASDVSSRIIAESLTAYGMKISVSAVSRHRRECERID